MLTPKLDMATEAVILNQANEISKLNAMLNKVAYVGYLWRPIGSTTWTFAEEDKPKAIKPEYEVKEVYSCLDK